MLTRKKKIEVLARKIQHYQYTVKYADNGHNTEPSSKIFPCSLSAILQFSLPNYEGRFLVHIHKFPTQELLRAVGDAGFKCDRSLSLPSKGVEGNLNRLIYLQGI
jgi:hypothetical protein